MQYTYTYTVHISIYRFTGNVFFKGVRFCVDAALKNRSCPVSDASKGTVSVCIVSLEVLEEWSETDNSVKTGEEGG